MVHWSVLLSFLVATGSFSQKTDDVINGTRSPFDLSVDDLTFRPFNKQDMRALDDVTANQQAILQPAAVTVVGRATDVTSSVVQPMPVQCDVISHGGCDVRGYERCREPGLCKCLNGFLRERTAGKCVAAQFFQGEISFDDRFQSSSLATGGSEYKTIVEGVQNLVFQALTTQGTRGVLMVQVTSLTRNSGRVIAKWELGMTSSVSPRQEELRIAYNKGIVNLTYVDDTDSFIKVNSHLVLGKNGSYATFLMPIIEFSHCLDKDHNYCDINADCYTNLGSSSCTCRQGFDDVSLDVKSTPGEWCVVTCGCKNNGTCDRDSSGYTTCRCPEWYLGSDCNVNGKDILIICCSVVGGLLVLVALLCVICICTRSRKSSRDSTVGVGSLDTSVVKLPRVWMDGARPYDLPPRDMRRWSYVSEPVRYVDDYVNMQMMDDYVHAETLPLPRSHDKKKYFAAYQMGGTLNHGYSSSTLSARPYSRH